MKEGMVCTIKKVPNEMNNVDNINGIKHQAYTATSKENKK